MHAARKKNKKNVPRKPHDDPSFQPGSSKFPSQPYGFPPMFTHDDRLPRDKGLDLGFDRGGLFAEGHFFLRQASERSLSHQSNTPRDILFLSKFPVRDDEERLLLCSFISSNVKRFCLAVIM